MAGRRRRDDSVLSDLYGLFVRFPLVGPVMAAALVFGGMRWVLPAVLHGFAGSQPTTSTNASAELGRAVSHGALTGIADGLSTTAPWVTAVLVGLPTIGAWLTVAWRRTPVGKPNRLRSQKPIRDALLAGAGPTPSQIRDLSWRDFETLVADAYRLDGYDVDQYGRRGPDGGVDLRLRRAGETTLVQCKHWKARLVGAPAVRELLGVVTQQQASAGIVITSGSFSEEARRFAAAGPIQLVDGLLLGRLLKRGATAPTGPALPPLPSPPPACPRCGAATVPRQSRYGPFYGCSRYPSCRGIVDQRHPTP